MVTGPGLSREAEHGSGSVVALLVGEHGLPDGIQAIRARVLSEISSGSRDPGRARSQMSGGVLLGTRRSGPEHGEAHANLH